MPPTTTGYNVQTPRQSERRGGRTVPHTKRYPQVVGGQCEFCGTLDRNQDSQVQYKLCPHFRGMTLECSYCDPTKNQEEVIRSAILNIHDHPTDRDESGRPTLVVVCNTYECSTKHRERFVVSG